MAHQPLSCALHTADDPPVRLCTGNIDRIGQPESVLTIVDNAGKKESVPLGGMERVAAALELMDRLVKSDGGGDLDAIGHRVVHGGAKYQRPQRVTPEMVAELHRISPFAPEHLPVQVELIEAIEPPLAHGFADRLF